MSRGSHTRVDLLGGKPEVCEHSVTQWAPSSYTEWRTKCHTIDCAHNTCLLLQKRLTSGTELILILTYLLTYLLTYSMEQSPS